MFKLFKSIICGGFTTPINTLDTSVVQFLRFNHLLNLFIVPSMQFLEYNKGYYYIYISKYKKMQYNNLLLQNYFTLKLICPGSPHFTQTNV